MKVNRLRHHFENNENFLLCCFTKQQYENCLRWCYDNGYLTDSEYKELTDIDVYDWFKYQDMLKQSFQKGGLCVHFNGIHFKGFGSYKIYTEVKECGEEPDLKFYSFVDEINERATIKSSIIYYCGSCGGSLFDNTYNKCPHCRVKLEK
jgi:hypothetical protein